MSAAAQVAVTLAGWAGAICAVVAYGLVTAKRITPDSAPFQGLNLVGAGLLAVSATVYGAWPSAVVNVIWVGIGVFALRALWRKHKSAVSAAVVEEIVFDGAEQDIMSAQQAEQFLALDAAEDLASEMLQHDETRAVPTLEASDIDALSTDAAGRNSAQRTPVAA